MNSDGRQVAWLLVELEHQTNGRLSDESKQLLLDEVAAHLDAAIQARLELGMTPLEAEVEAVEAFGHPQSYVDDLLSVHERSKPTVKNTWYRSGDRRTLITLSILSAFCTVCILTGIPSFENPATLIAVLAALPVFAVFSFKARRIQAIPVAIVCAATFITLNLGMSLTWRNLWAHGGTGTYPQWQMEQLEAHAHSTVAKLDQMLVPLQHRAALHAKYPHEWNLTGATTDEMRELLEFPLEHRIEPRDSSQPGWVTSADRVISYTMAGDPITANILWQRHGVTLFQDVQLEREETIASLNAIHESESAPRLSELLANVSENAIALPVWLLLWMGVNLSFGGLGLLLSPQRRRRRSLA